MCAEPCKQPRGGAPDPPGAAGKHHDHVFEDIGCEGGAMHRKLIVRQAESIAVPASYYQPWRSISLQQLACDDHLADFRRAGADLQQLDRAIEPVDLGLPDVAAAAMDLHGLVEHCVAGLGSVHHRGRGQHVDIAASAAADFQGAGFRQRAIGEGPHGFDRTYISASID